MQTDPSPDATPETRNATPETAEAETSTAAGAAERSDATAETPEAAPPCAPEAAATDQDAELLQAIDQIDYSAYESPELRASIEAILSVPGTLLFFLRVVGLSFPLCQLLITWSFSDKGWLTLGAAVVAGLVASLIFAVLLGMTLCLRRILNELVKVIEQTLTIVGTVIDDIGAAGDEGIVKTTACVFGGVSRNLVLPIVESVVRAQLGFLGRPLLWLYRRVFIRLVDAATNRILLAASKIPVPGRAHLAPTSQAVGQRLKSGAETANWFFQTLQPYVVGGSRALSLSILIPAWILLGFATVCLVALFWGAHWAL